MAGCSRRPGRRRGKDCSLKTRSHHRHNRQASPKEGSFGVGLGGQQRHPSCRSMQLVCGRPRHRRRPAEGLEHALRIRREPAAIAYSARGVNAPMHCPAYKRMSIPGKLLGNSHAKSRTAQGLAGRTTSAAIARWIDLAHVLHPAVGKVHGGCHQVEGSAPYVTRGGLAGDAALDQQSERACLAQAVGREDWECARRHCTATSRSGAVANQAANERVVWVQQVPGRCTNHQRGAARAGRGSLSCCRKTGVSCTLRSLRRGAVAVGVADRELRLCGGRRRLPHRDPRRDGELLPDIVAFPERWP
mmetsp:Transcript_16779/g.63566  ORF Transcript_16779/g.63566 Transcript_16779/m.63566 type:complete len:303 (-) Transcript_16779:1190-2098(-)